MRTIWLVLCLGALGVAVNCPQSMLWAADDQDAPPQAGEQQRIAALIEQLDHEQFVERKEAEELLLTIGSPAIDQIKAATKHFNTEIRRSADRILTILKRRSVDAYVATLEARVAAFLDEASGAALPGWEQFKRVVGDDHQARRLFADMHRVEPRLLLTYAHSPADAAVVWPSRVKQHWRDKEDYPGRRLPLETAAALLWVSLEPSIELPDNQRYWSSQQNWLMQLLLQQQADDVAQNAAIRKLIACEIERPISDEAQRNYQFATQKIKLAERFKLKKEGIAFASRLLKDESKAPNGWQPPVRAFGLLAFYVLGDADDIEKIEPLLNDKTVCWQRRDTIIQVRDVALGVMLLLTKQDVADYHLKNLANLKVETVLRNFNQFAPFTFKTPQQRDEALARWRKWSAANR